MSDPQPNSTVDELTEDTLPTNDEEKTHPTEEILNALAQINTQSIPTLSASQETQLDEPKQQSQDAPAPPDTPPSEYDTLRAQLREKPTDADLWLKLIDLAEASGDYNLTVQAYEDILESYPNNVGRFMIVLRGTFSHRP